MTQELSSSERHTWQVIQDKYQEIPKLSISELADMAFVSISTVNRTVRKKGYNGYADFRYSIKEKTLPTISKFSTEIMAAISKNEEEICKTINNVSPEIIEEAVRAIDRATEILIFAKGMSKNAGIEMQKKLLLYHKVAPLYESTDSMKYYASFANLNSLIIAVSLFGETEGIIDAVRIAQEKGGKVLVLTATESSTLASLADICLSGYKSRLEVNYFSLDVHSRIPLYILVRVLFDSFSILKKQSLV